MLCHLNPGTMINQDNIGYMTQVEEINARELYLRPVTPQQLLARLPSDQLAVKVSREDFEVKHCHPVCIGLLYHSMVLIISSDSVSC